MAIDTDGGVSAPRAGVLALLAAAALASLACGPQLDEPVVYPTVNDRPMGTREPSPITSQAAPQCLPPGVSIRESQGDGSAGGRRDIELELTNCGTGPYTVQGAPVVRVLDAARVPFDINVGQYYSVPEGYGGAPQRLTIKPGERLVAWVAYRNIVEAWASVVQGTYLEVAPAEGQPAHLLTRFSPYQLGNSAQITVGPWVRPPATG
ncbi:MAG TPA: DUF4232 domain-containing protein [Dactylosporangium sp.]|nr:DUF4232 domain-containing protein [Dactylosporangium sp.]